MLLYLYDEINIIIEGHLYWIHRTDTNSWPEIFTLLAVMMSSFVAINIIALYLAHVIWGRYVAQTTALFSSVLDKIIDLDFSDLQSPKQGHHRIVDLIERWFEKEQKRNRGRVLQIKRLSGYEGKVLELLDHETIKQILNDYRRLLTGD